MAALVERPAHLANGPLASPFRALVVVGDTQARARVMTVLAGLGASEIAEAASVGEARVRAGAGGPRDLAVLDLSLPDGPGLGLLTELRAAGWGRGVVLSGQQDPYTVRAALAAGVRCLLIERADDLRGTAVAIPLRLRGTGVDGLSARELEVLQLVAGGRSNRDIGADLGLSALTVKSHLARIARKLGTGDRAEMVVLVLRAGAIS